MERGAAGGDGPARGAGGMCDRLLTFLTNSLHMNKQKSITEGPGNGGGYRQLEEEDEFAIRIERAELEFSDHGDDGPAGVTTVLEDATIATASDEQRQKPAAAATAADRPVAAAAAAVEETKIKKTVTIKEDRADEAASGGGKGAPALERKKSLLKKRQASSSSGGAGEEQGGRQPRRSGLRPRMPAVLRVPSNINERSSTFIEERRKSFGSGGKTAAPAGK